MLKFQFNSKIAFPFYSKHWRKIESMSEPYVAPYGGLMTKTLEDEKAQEEKIKEETVDITVNGVTETVRPEALHVQGVDSLSTEDIKAFVDYYLNHITIEKEETIEETGETVIKQTYEPLPIDEQKKFRIQWVNDTSVNITFKNSDDCREAFVAISITSPVEEVEVDFNNPQYVSGLVQSRETKPFNPVIEFRKKQNLSERLGLPVSEPEEPALKNDMDEDESAVVLYVRQALQSDRKVKNASAYSRYYLLHGEPERKPFRKNQYRERDSFRGRKQRGYERDDDDLFANKLKKNKGSRDMEEDLFSHKLNHRDKSPVRRRSRSRSPMRD